MRVNRGTRTGEHEDDSERQPERENQQNESIDTTGATESSPRLATYVTVGVGVGVAVGAVGAVLLAPVALAGLGFGAAGVTAGSIGAAYQSSVGMVAAGSWFAALQSAGAAGLAPSTFAGIGVAGGTAGAALGGAAGSLSSRFRSGFRRLRFPTVDRSTQTDEKIILRKREKIIEGKKMIKFVSILAGSAIAMTLIYRYFA